MRFFTLLKTKDVAGATLLVTGCCVGAGMIGLPVMSALAGFMPSALAMLLCYFFTTVTGLLLLEATLWFDDKVILSSIVELTLGKLGKVITLALFLFLFYCLFVAYLDGGGALFADMLSAVFHHPVPRAIGIITCLLFVGAIAYAGTRLVDGLNRILLLGLIASYAILVIVGLPNVRQTNLSYVNLTAMLGTIPILLISFGYHNLVPSITYYLKKNVNTIRFAIIIGNFIPLLIYFLWDFVILGMLSHNNAAHADMATQLLQGATHSLSIIFFIKAFSLFALLTSFIPNTLSFVDFLKDGLKKTIIKNQKNDLLLYGLVFIPPLVCVLFKPHIFLKALGFAGGFIDVLLFGVIPAMVILVGRNIKKLAGPYQVLGGNVTPVCVLVISMAVLSGKLLGL